MNIVIIGFGMAGFTVASAALKLEENFVTTVSDENVSPYYRIRILETLSSEPSLLADISSFPEERFEQIDGVKVLSIDRKGKHVVLSDGRTLPYDKLVIATGAEANRIKCSGSESEGILALRTLEDVEEMKSLLSGSKRAAVIGGGLLGLEAGAHIAAYTGSSVSVIESAPYLLPRQLDEDSSAYLRKKLEERGLSFFTDAKVDSFLNEEGRVKGIKLADGSTVPADVVIESVGVTPRTSLAKEIGLAIKRGIVTDERCRTSDEDIYAVGDCAEIEGMCPAMMAFALDTGAVCGANLAGGDKVYKAAPCSAMLKVAGLDVLSFGSISREGVEAYVKEDGGVRECVLVKDGIIEGATAIGSRAHFALFRSNIGKAFSDEFRSKAGL